MNGKDQLPEGYTPIKYIEYRPKQERFFAFGHFERFKDALEYANHINAVCKKSISKITTYQIQDNVLFCIIIYIYERCNNFIKDYPERQFVEIDWPSYMEPGKIHRIIYIQKKRSGA